jgi:hypothetical protein
MSVSFSSSGNDFGASGMGILLFWLFPFNDCPEGNWWGKAEMGALVEWFWPLLAVILLLILLRG